MPIHRPLISSYAVVLRADDCFPLDMLRYAESWPATTDDAVLIEHLIKVDISGLPKRVIVNLCLPRELDSYVFAQYAARWESFDIKVLTDPDEIADETRRYWDARRAEAGLAHA